MALAETDKGKAWGEKRTKKIHGLISRINWFDLLQFKGHKVLLNSTVKVSILHFLSLLYGQFSRHMHMFTGRNKL